MMIIAAVAPPGRPPGVCMFPVLFPLTLNEVGAVVGKEGPSVVGGCELNVVFMFVVCSVVSTVVVCIVGVSS